MAPSPIEAVPPPNIPEQTSPSTVPNTPAVSIAPQYRPFVSGKTLPNPDVFDFAALAAAHVTQRARSQDAQADCIDVHAKSQIIGDVRGAGAHDDAEPVVPVMLALV